MVFFIVFWVSFVGTLVGLAVALTSIVSAVVDRVSRHTAEANAPHVSQAFGRCPCRLCKTGIARAPQ